MDTPQQADADDLSPAHEAFYGHRVPPYKCPACAAGVLLLLRETLHVRTTAESKMLDEETGPEIGAGQWRFSCLFQCCGTDCAEVVACAGTMSWARDPRLLPNETIARAWAPGMGRIPDLDEQMRRAQAELAHRFQPIIFLPEVEGKVKESGVIGVRAATDYTWMNVGLVRYSFKPGRQADSIRVLFQAWIDGGRRDGSGMHEEEIGRRTDSSAARFRIDHVFVGHPIFGRVLRSVGKGQWALFFTPPDGRSSSESDAA